MTQACQKRVKPADSECFPLNNGKSVPKTADKPF